VFALGVPRQWVGAVYGVRGLCRCVGGGVEANELSLIGAAFVSTFLVAFIFGAGVGFWVGVNDKDPATILHEQTIRTEEGEE
jgi:hypothetical protein